MIAETIIEIILTWLLFLVAITLILVYGWLIYNNKEEEQPKKNVMEKYIKDEQ